jgi:two-component system sensor histidine kinase YesM
LLGSILRYSISDMNQLVSLGDEIAQVRKYIQLQEQRFHSQYHVELEIDPKYYSFITPKMILQPIVENAIYHGMSSVRSGGIISVTATQPDRNTLLLLVHDNGTGMDAEQVRNLNGYIREENNLFKSIGMRNVNRRIQLFCGSDYGVHVESTPDEGTTVTLRLRIDTN